MAPLPFLRARDIPRTKISHLKSTSFAPLSSFEYPTRGLPTDGYVFRQTFPPRITNAPTAFAPPPHYHIFQAETFRVESGAGLWYIGKNKPIRLEQGDEITIPARSRHWFDSIPCSTESLTVSWKFDPEFVEMEERFFRNVTGDREDRRKAGQKQSIFQIMVFARYFWMPVALPIPGPEFLNFALSTMFLFVMAFVGEYLLGYRRSYPEYYEDRKSQ